MTKPGGKRRKPSGPIATVCIYVRVSTNEQARTGAGLAAQEAECREFAERQGWTVTGFYVDDVETGTSGTVHPTERLGLAAAVSALDAGEADVLLVRRQDRISRRVRHLLEFVERADLGRWAIATTDGKLDTTSAAGKFQTTVLAAAAELERDLAVERTREGMAIKREQGVRLGRPSQVPHDLRDLIIQSRFAGLSFAAIADDFNARGVPTVRGGRRWYPATVRAVVLVVENDAYAEERRMALSR